MTTRADLYEPVVTTTLPGRSMRGVDRIRHLKQGDIVRALEREDLGDRLWRVAWFHKGGIASLYPADDICVAIDGSNMAIMGPDERIAPVELKP